MKNVDLETPPPPLPPFPTITQNFQELSLVWIGIFSETTQLIDGETIVVCGITYLWCYCVKKLPDIMNLNSGVWSST